MDIVDNDVFTSSSPGSCCDYVRKLLNNLGINIGGVLRVILLSALFDSANGEGKDAGSAVVRAVV